MVEVRRMDNFLESPGADYYWCNGCKLWHHHSVYCTVRAPDPLTAARDEVVKAAEELRRGNLWGRPLRLDEQALCDALDHLRSLQHPQGKKPEEVEPGTRFRFMPHPGEAGTGLCVLYRADDKPLWTMDGDAMLYRFGPDDRILPIPE